MRNSVIHKLYSESYDTSLYEKVFESKYGKVKIFKIQKVDQESKLFSSEHYLCDESEKWLCRGQYPPKLRPYMDTKKDFAQMENFNVKRDETSEEYQKKYHSAFT